MKSARLIHNSFLLASEIMFLIRPSRLHAEIAPCEELYTPDFQKKIGKFVPHVCFVCGVQLAVVFFVPCVNFLQRG
jgi:hypothetical protein